MIIWPKELISDIARRRTVLFLGSGISQNSTSLDGRRPKTWAELLMNMTEKVSPNRHIKKLIKENDFLTSCEILKKELGREVFFSCLKDEFLNPGYRPAPIHENIFKLDSRIVATPNFDKIYESYANHAAKGSIVVKHHFDPDIAEAIRGTDRVILKIHGTIDSPDRMIFTRREYAEAREKYRGFYSLLEALALTHTFLFLGCGINDPDMRLLLEDNFFRYNSSRSHIFVLSSKSIHNSVKNIIQESMNLNILTYNPAHTHKELCDSIEQLVNLVEEERDRIRIEANW